MRAVVAALFVAVLLLLAAPSAAEAQTQVINPRWLEFDVSTDHGAQLPDGQPAVTRYEARWYAQGASSPLTVTDLAKPNPQSGTRVRVDLAATIAAIPVGMGYTARVFAIGPGGEGASLPSNPFGVVSQPGPATNVTLGR